MEDQAATQPVTSRVSLDEGVRTCRPAIIRQTLPDGVDSEGTPTPPDGNIIRGED